MSDVRDETAGSVEENETSPINQKRHPEFHPITIKGEPLSETIIRDRR
jgi:hypothetical protein